jgi:hypothetical protein
MSATLIAHRGAKVVERHEVELIDAPPSTKSWYPLRHSEVLEVTESRLRAAGFSIKREQYALSKDGARFFGTLDLGSGLAEGVTLAVGIRNSIDKSFPIGLCCGSRVFVCDNLAFSSEIVIAKKHTRFGLQRFHERLSDAMTGLAKYQEIETARITRFQDTILNQDRANSLILQAYEAGIISTLLLPQVIQEYRKPQHSEFEPRTVWSLLNAFTEAMKPRQNNPVAFADATVRLYGLLDGQTNYALAT